MRGLHSNKRIQSFYEIKPEKVYPFVTSDCHIHTTPRDSWLFHPGKNSTKTNFRSYISKKIDHTDEEIIFSCDGRTPLKTILKVLKNVYRIPENKVYYFLDWLLQEGIIDYAYEPLHSSSFPTFGGSRDYFVPLHLFLELTDSCNQRCVHCYRESGPGNNQFMNKENFFRMAENLSLEGTLVVEFTGGEPLLHPYFDEMLSLAAEYFDLVSVITNGTLLDEQKVSLLSNLNKYETKVFVSITLNSYKSSFHDWFVGMKGSFEKALRALRLLEAASVPVRVSMNVSRENLNDILPTAELAFENGASIFAAAPVNPEGRALNSRIFIEDDSDWARFDIEFMKLKSIYPDKVFVLPEPTLKEIFDFGCGAGTKTIAICPEGNIRPCVMFDRSFTFGNIFSEDLEHLLSEKNLGVFSDVESPSSLGCERCKNFSYCNGCLKRMLMKASENSECGLNKKGFSWRS
ncbi:MAG: radical SAM protein [Actinobacteria bacterium]|nr:radical SAM protein [Actinomycetota bacterium]